MCNCSNEKINQYPNIELPVIAAKNYEGNIYLTSFVDSMELIPLSETKNLVLPPIQKLACIPNGFAVKCFNREQLYFFSLDGQYISKIDVSKDGSPGISSVSDFEYEPMTNSLIISDINRHRLCLYSFEKDSIIKEAKFKDYPIYDVSLQGDHIYAITNDRLRGFIKVLGWDGTVAETKVTDPVSFNMVVTGNSILRSNDTLFMNPGFTDTIYYAWNDKIHPYLILGHGENSMASLELETFMHDFLDRNFKPYNQDILVPWGSIFRHQDYWFIQIAWPFKTLVWDRSMKRAVVLDRNQIKDVALFFPHAPFTFLDEDDQGYAYSAILPTEQFYAQAQALNSTHPDSHVNRIVQSFVDGHPEEGEFENPIIVKMKLGKNFINLLE